MPPIAGRILVTGPSASGKSTLARYFRAHGVNAVDGDDVRGLGRPVDIGGHPLRRITKEQWRRVEDWRFSWHEPTLKRFLARHPDVVLFGCSDDMFDLDLGRLFDRCIFLRATWPVIRARLNSATRDNDWGRDDQPAQREWVRNAVREWPVKARARGFEFVDATLSPARILAEVRNHDLAGRGRPSERQVDGRNTHVRRRLSPKGGLHHGRPARARRARRDPMS